MDTSHASIFPFYLSSSLPPPCVDPPAPLEPAAPPPPAVLLLLPGTLPPLRVVASTQLWQLFCLVFDFHSSVFDDGG